MYYIYKMMHPQSGRVYIGQHKAKRGCVDYVNDGYFGSGKIWIRIYKKHPNECIKVVLEVAETKEQIDALEIKYIAHYKAVWGDYCVNIAKGGGGGPGPVKRFTDEELKEHQNAWRRKRRAEHGDIVRAKEKAYRDTHREQKHAKDKRHYQKHKEKVLEYQRNYQEENPDKVREKNRRYKAKKNANRVYKASEETRAIMSENNSGENNPFYGKKHSEETRLKMRQAWERRRAKKQAEKDKNKP